MFDNCFKLDDSWGKINKIVIWGYGRHGKRIVDKLQKDFEIIAIIDSDPHKIGTTKDGIPIIQFDDAEDILKKIK